METIIVTCDECDREFEETLPIDWSEVLCPECYERQVAMDEADLLWPGE